MVKINAEQLKSFSAREGAVGNSGCPHPPVRDIPLIHVGFLINRSENNIWGSDPGAVETVEVDSVRGRAMLIRVPAVVVNRGIVIPGEGETIPGDRIDPHDECGPIRADRPHHPDLAIRRIKEASPQIIGGNPEHRMTRIHRHQSARPVGGGDEIEIFPVSGVEMAACVSHLVVVGRKVCNIIRGDQRSIEPVDRDLCSARVDIEVCAVAGESTDICTSQGEDRVGGCLKDVAFCRREHERQRRPDPEIRARVAE